MHICSMKTVVRTRNNRGVLSQYYFPSYLVRARGLKMDWKGSVLIASVVVVLTVAMLTLTHPAMAVKAALLTSLNGNGFCLVRI
jgi:hypothetical protein